MDVIIVCYLYILNVVIAKQFGLYSLPVITKLVVCVNDVTGISGLSSVACTSTCQCMGVHN